MTSFSIALTNVLVMLFYLVPGYIVRKMHKASEDHLPTLSALLVYIGTPFLEVSQFLTLDFDVGILLNMGLFFVITLVAQGAFMVIVWFVLRDRGNAFNRVLVAASAMGNVGFFGAPLTRALLPDFPEAPCYIVMYMLSMNLLVFTVGTFFITGDRKYISVRSLLFNPTTFGLVIALPCFIFGLKNYLPAALVGAVTNVGNMTAPLCMFILGIRLASAPLKDLLRYKRAFFAPLLKLVLYPLFAFALVYFLPIPYTLKAVTLVVSSVPCASVLLSLSEMYKGERAFAANCILTSTLLCFLTIPVLMLLL